MEFSMTQHIAAIKFRSLLPLFSPWLLSCTISYNPVASYFCAWLGSLFIFYHSVFSVLKPLTRDGQLKHQIMRPMILIQLVFAGLMSASSIFYFLDHLGFYWWSQSMHQDFKVNPVTYQLAYCQRLYVFAHAALVLGMIIAVKPNQPPTYKWSGEIKNHLTGMLLVVLLVSFCLSSIPAFKQFSVLLLPVPRCLAALMVLQGLRFKKFHLVVVGCCFYGFTLYQSAYSGYKEGLFVGLILLVFILYPYYKHIVSALAVPTLLLMIYLLPTWNSTIRTASWLNDVPVEKAAEEAYAQLVDDDNQIVVKQNSWDFLINRFSEIGMFSRYVDHVPTVRPYYGTQILEHAIAALIPRALWPAKPNTEEQSMERVYEAGVVSEDSDASAKTRMVVDGYLSAGLPGVLIAMVCYGLVCQSLCNQAERLFGGYEAGCVVIFNGMFQQLWRGNNFEFILNNIVYGWILMLLSFQILRYADLLIPATEYKR